VIILGTGPAGLTAAIYAARADLEPLIVEGPEPGGQLMLTTEIENFPGFADGIMGSELMAATKAQAERFGAETVMAMCEAVDASKRPFKVTLDGDVVTADTLIIATGASARWLGIESEKAYIGKGVTACAVCDGAFFRDVPVAVIGGGDSAMEEAHFLTKFASKVYIVHRRGEFRASKFMQARAQDHPKIEFVLNKTVDGVCGDGNIISHLSLVDTVTHEKSSLEVEGMFLAIGHNPNTKVFEGLLELDETGYVITEKSSMKTSVEGIYACGDVQDTVYRQAITAAGTGCMAALDAEKYLEHNGLA
jgi:thioredoxin reductase (NADPH)